MSGPVLQFALVASHSLLAAAMLVATWRVVRGPRAQDRMVGLDTLYLNGMLLMLTLGIRFETSFYFEAALVVALLGFVSTAALAKFLMRGEVIE